MKKKLDAGHYRTTTGNVVIWGTPEYKKAYDKGEVITDKGVKSPVTIQGQKLKEVVVKNNYKITCSPINYPSWNQASIVNYIKSRLL